VTWLDRAESFHRVLMREAKLMHNQTAAAAAPANTATGGKAPAAR
jgi:hypothetical protein